MGKCLTYIGTEGFPFLAARKEALDVIFCEQELNHLTKKEMLVFLRLVRESLTPGGTLIVHGLNGANPITGSEALAQNFDHYNTFTEYTMRPVREEMAIKLADVVFRRTDLATGQHPGHEALKTCAQLMAKELDWTTERLQAEIEAVEQVFPLSSPSFLVIFGTSNFTK